MRQVTVVFGLLTIGALSAVMTWAQEPQPVPPAPAEPAAAAPAQEDYEPEAETNTEAQSNDSYYYEYVGEGTYEPSWWERIKASRFGDRIRRIHDRLGGTPHKPKPAPLGTLVNAHVNQYIQRGRDVRMVFYQYDFVAGTAALNRAGQKKLKQIGDWLPKSFAPVVIEESGKDSKFDQERRKAIITALNGLPFPVPDERVIVGSPVSKGLGPAEANIILLNQFNQTQRRGILNSGSGGGASGGNQGNANQYQNQSLGAGSGTGLQ